jgi:hypothetical protein
MKCVITYIQNKRVALPYIFGKYCLPQMRKHFPGDMELIHVHHDSHVEDTQLHSSRFLGERHLQNVQQFILENRYPDATFISHKEINWDLMLIPSAILAAEAALERNADLHLWIEDDAIVYDQGCRQWPSKISCDLGTYRNTYHQKMVVCSYFISKPAFDDKLIPCLKKYKKERGDKYLKHGSQYEHLLYNIVEGKMSLLNSDCAYRHHLHSTYRKTRADVETWLKKHLPISSDDLSLLKLDFDA